MQLESGEFYVHVGSMKLGPASGTYMLFGVDDDDILCCPFTPSSGRHLLMRKTDNAPLATGQVKWVTWSPGANSNSICCSLKFELHSDNLKYIHHVKNF